MAMNKKTWTANFILLLIAFIWGGTFVLVENAISFFPPFLFNSVRFWLAAAALWLIIGTSYRAQLSQISKHLILAGFILGVCLFAGFITQTIGLIYTTSGKAGFITGLNVVLVPFLSSLLLKIKLKKNALLGICLSTIGLYLLAFGDLSAFNQGDLYVLLCALFFALQIVLTSKYAPHYPTLILATIQVTTVALLCSLGSLFNGEWNILFGEIHLLLEPAVFWALLICALLATAFAYVAQTELQRFTTPTQVALIFATEPVFAALADYWWNGRILPTLSLLGCLFILLGMILAELEGKGKKKCPTVYINQENKRC